MAALHQETQEQAKVVIPLHLVLPHLAAKALEILVLDLAGKAAAMPMQMVAVLAVQAATVIEVVFKTLAETPVAAAQVVIQATVAEVVIIIQTIKLLAQVVQVAVVPTADLANLVVAAVVALAYLA